MQSIFKKYFTLFTKFSYKQWTIVGVVAVVVVGGAFAFSGSEGTTTLYTVASTTVVQTVSVSGETKASSYVDMAFEQAGTVSGIGAVVGARVGQGQLLVRLDQNKAYADVLAAEANLDLERARLGDAQVSLEDAEDTLNAALRDAYTQADDAVRNYADRFIKNPETSPSFELSFEDGSRTVSFDTFDSTLKYSVSSLRREVAKLLPVWKQDVNNSSFLNNREEAVRVTQERLDTVRRLLDTLSLVVNSLDTSYFEYQTLLGQYKTNIATARTNVNSAGTDLTNAKRDWNTARLSAASSNDGQLSTQAAQIKQAEAQVAEKRALLAKLSLVAPIAGVVTKQEAKVGEAVTAGEVVVSIINPDAFEIEANIPEINIGKVSVGQTATITLDAFPGEEFTGSVFYIDPAETIVDGVVNYKIKVAFADKDARLKNGLTANLIISTGRREGVLAVPLSAISTEDGKSVVQVVVGDETRETVVTTGMYGDDGLVEIVSGLKPGDVVVVGE